MKDFLARDAHHTDESGFPRKLRFLRRRTIENPQAALHFNQAKRLRHLAWDTVALETSDYPLKPNDNPPGPKPRLNPLAWALRALASSSCAGTPRARPSKPVSVP